MSHHHARLGVVALGFALGITSAIGLLLLGWGAEILGWGRPLVEMMGGFYVGYQPTFWGAVVGAIWGFVHSFIAGVIIAAIYNACVCGKACGKEQPCCPHENRPGV